MNRAEAQPLANAVTRAARYRVVGTNGQGEAVTLSVEDRITHLQYVLRSPADWLNVMGQCTRERRKMARTNRLPDQTETPETPEPEEPTMSAPVTLPSVTQATISTGTASSTVQVSSGTLGEVLALLLVDAGEIRLDRPDQAFRLTVTGGKGDLRWAVEHYGKSRSERNGQAGGGVASVAQKDAIVRRLTRLELPVAQEKIDALTRAQASALITTLSDQLHAKETAP